MIAYALDLTNKIIYELKPYNANSLKRAVKQVNKYIEALGEGFTVVIDMYVG